MARLYNTGFEFNTNTSGMEWTTSSGGFVVQSTIKRSGGYAGRANPTASTRFMQHRFQADAINTTYHRFYLRIATAPASTIELWSYQDATTKAFSLNITNGRVLEMVNPISSATVLASSSALAIDTWYRVEMKIVDHATTSAEFELKIDGVVVSSQTGLTGLAGGGIFNLGAVTGATSPDLYFDDLGINDTTGSNETGYLGEGKLVLALPTGAGDNAATTGIYSYINEIPPTDTATSGSTMIELDTTTSIGDYAMTDSSTLGIASTDVIKLTQVMARIREEAAGASNYTLRIKSASGATVSASASVDAGNATARTNPNSTTAFTNLRVNYIDPTTGVAWTPTGTNSIDNMQAGVATTDGTPDVWCLFLGVYIEYYSPVVGVNTFGLSFKGPRRQMPPLPVIDWSNGITRGLVLCMPFAQLGGVPLDISNFKLKGTNVNNPTWGYGDMGPEMKFVSASSQYVDLGNPTHLQITDYLSIATHYRLASTPGGQEMQLFAKDGNSGGRAYTLDLSNSSGTRFYVNGGGGAAEVREAGGVVAGDSKAVGAVYLKGGNARLIIDGKQVSTSSSMAATIPTATANASIGRRTYAGAEGYFDGVIKYLYVWNRPLSNAEFKAIADNPWCIFKRYNPVLTSETSNVTQNQTITGKGRINKSVSQTILGRGRIRVSVLRTILGKSRIGLLTSRTITGLSRVTKTVARTITGKGNIRVTTLRTILGRSRIGLITARTITGLSRVTKSVSQTILGRARIQLITLRTITGISRIRVSVLQTILGKARVTASTSRTIGGMSAIRKTTNRTITGLSRIRKTVIQTITGISTINVASDRDITGISRIGVITAQTIQGISRITKTVSRTITGIADIRKSVSRTINGISRIGLITTKTITGISDIRLSVIRTINGISRITIYSTKTILGLARITGSVDRDIQGLARVDTSTLRTIDGIARVETSVSQTINGKARITGLVNSIINGISRIVVTVDQNILGRSRVTASNSRVINGLARIQNLINQPILGRARITKIVNAIITGKARVGNVVVKNITGKANLVVIHNQTITGKARIIRHKTKSINVSIRPLRNSVAVEDKKIILNIRSLRGEVAVRSLRGSVGVRKLTKTVTIEKL